MLLVAALLAGCASPVPRDRLAEVDQLTLLKQMQWLDRDAGSFDFGPGGRAGYVDGVRDEILRRHPEWPQEVVQAIRAQRVELGMTRSQVVTSIGWPREYPEMLWANAPGTEHSNDLAVYSRRSTMNSWTYGKPPEVLRLHFRDGRVVWLYDTRGATIREEQAKPAGE